MHTNNKLNTIVIHLNFFVYSCR